MRPLNTKTYKHSLLVAFLLCLGACKESEFYEKPMAADEFRVDPGTGGGVLPDPTVNVVNPPVPPIPPVIPPTPVDVCKSGVASTDIICNPLGGGDDPDPGTENPTTGSRIGLLAKLFEGQSGWNSLNRYFTEGYKHSEVLYFSNFNVPPRSFSEGFGYGESDYLKNIKGEKLVEWFAIQAKGNVVLPENELSGHYHIATLSDDGIKASIGGKAIVENRNHHSPTIDCSSSLVEFKPGESRPFMLNYFQGPRFRIALVVYIKKIDDVAAFKKESFCSKATEDTSLLSKAGYRVMSPSWFTLPDSF